MTLKLPAKGDSSRELSASDTGLQRLEGSQSAWRDTFIKTFIKHLLNVLFARHLVNILVNILVNDPNWIIVQAVDFNYSQSVPL